MRVIVNIDVPDLALAIAFYSTALSLKLNRIMEDDVAELTGASCVIYLLQNRAGSHPVSSLSVVRDYARHWTPVHMDFVVDDVAKAAKRAMDAGAIRETECIEWKNSKCLTFSDPFGHGFCLIEFAGEAYSAGDA